MKKIIEAVVCKKCGLLVDKSRATVISAKNWSGGSVFEELYCFIHRPQYNRRYGNLYYKEVECDEWGNLPGESTITQSVKVRNGYLEVRGKMNFIQRLGIWLIKQ